MSYPKYIMQLKLGRELLPGEVVDHIDDDPTNNKEENFQVITNQENMLKYSIPIYHEWFVCPVCSDNFHVRGSQYRNNQLKKKRAGPFCSRSCAGRYNASRQYGTYEFDKE